VDRRALSVGIDNYTNVAKLNCCVADAKSIQQLIQRNQDGTPNYDCKLLLASSELGSTVSRAQLRDACQQLFDFTGDVLLYFSGHGALTTSGGYLATSDAAVNDVGVPMYDIMQWAYTSRARDILLILDCCHSGDLGNPPVLNIGGPGDPLALLRENMTIIAAARDTQDALEADGHGLFTEVLLDALDGGAADHMGWVSGPAIYSYVERHFSAWGQRPVYKSHVTGVSLVRKCAPLIERIKLVELVKLFPEPHYRLQLDPEFEPEDEHGNVHHPVNQEKVQIAKLLKQFRDVGLLKGTIPDEQLFWVARRSHTVELTPRGREYWRLLKFGRI
jgi:caspase domain-containing protein